MFVCLVVFVVIWRVWRRRKKKKNSDWFYSCLEFLVAVAVKWASGMLMTGMLFSSRGSWPLKSQPRHKSIPICHGNIRGSHLVAQNWGQFVWREACVRSECYMCKSRQLYSTLMAQSKIFSAWALRALWRLVENPAEKWLCWARGQSNPTIFHRARILQSGKVILRSYQHAG